MSQRPDRTSARLQIPRRVIGAVTTRLEGRWEHPSAWRVLCEELTSVWRCAPDVRWAALVPRGPLGGMGADDGTGDQVTLWRSAAGAVVWRDNPCEAGLWADLAAATHGLLAGQGRPPCPLVDVAGQGVGWLALGVSAGGTPSLALILGLDRPVAAKPQDDPLADELLDAASFMAPALGQRRRHIDLAGELATVRAESETLSRLGDLRAHLAAVTAHELKTPLTSITAYAEVLEHQGNDPKFTYGPEFLKVIRSEADRLLRLVDRLLDSSRRGRSQALTETHPVVVEALVADVLRTMTPQATTRDLQLVGRVPEGLPPIAGDDDLIRQVLVNLLGNALKFTPAGGRVVLSVREDSSMLRLAVTDNGPGIAPRELRAIFQSFYRTRSARQTEGVGLGLSIVKEITTMHGGHLDVQSRLGRGTTFSVLLPKQQWHGSESTVVTEAGFDPVRQLRINDLSLRVVGELAAARGVMILMPQAAGGPLVPVAGMGLDHEPLTLEGMAGNQLQATLRNGPQLASWPPTGGRCMLAPFRLGALDDQGLLVVGRRLGGGQFGEDDLVLLQVLSEVLGNAWSALLAPDSDRRVLDQVVEALASLSGVRRGGVPTADPLALRLLSRTARRLGQSSYEIRLLQYAGALHDVGMVLLDAEVVNKPEGLDIDEKDHVGRHPQRSLEVLGPLVDVPDLQLIIRHHHERVDGRGYPEGRRGDAIPLGARIMAVVDAFFAMIRSRPWRDGLSVAAAVREIELNAGTQFDREVVAAFQDVLLEEGLLGAGAVDGTVASPSGR